MSDLAELPHKTTGGSVPPRRRGRGRQPAARTRPLSSEVPPPWSPERRRCPISNPLSSPLYRVGRATCSSERASWPCSRRRWPRRDAVDGARGRDLR